MIVKQLNINNSEECKKWEDFVIKNGYLYQSYKWITILKAYNFKDYYLYLENNGVIISVLPLFYVKFPFIKNELVSIPHMEAGGFINSEYYEYFFDYILNNINSKNILIFQYKERIDDFEKNDINSIFMINVPDSIEKIEKIFKKTFKRNLKNILKRANVEIIKGNSDELVKILYNLNVIKHKEFGVPHHSYEFLYNLINTFSNNGIILAARRDNKFIGASYIIFYNNIGYHIYHFVPQKYLKEKIGIVLYYYLFLECFNRGIKIFSFGRSPKGSNVYDLKKRFGAKEYPLYIYNFKIKNRKIIDKKIKTVGERFSWATYIWTKSPKILTDLISPYLRRWIY